MTLGPLEALTAAIGDELTDMFGFASTRLTSTVYAERQIQSAINSADYDGSTSFSLASGTLLATVGAGHRVRILSGSLIGAEALIQTRDDDQHITLASPLPNAVALTGISWEIVIDANETIPVENATEFPPAGQVVIDGVLYSYASRTPTTIDGLTRDDGTGLIVSGVQKQHDPLSIVSDYSRVTSAIDQYRRSYLLDYASGQDLDVIGRNLGVERPPELSDDETYRALIKALAYAPRGTIYAMEQVLDALLGETQVASGSQNASSVGDVVGLVSGAFPADIVGKRFRIRSGYLEGRTIRIAERVDSTHIRLNMALEEDVALEDWEITSPNWDLFEDLTGKLRHGCRVYVRKTTEQDTQFVGKTFLDGEDLVPLATSGTIDYTGRDHLRVAGVRLADEGGEWTVASGGGTDLNTASSVDGKVVSCPDFSDHILPGDTFVITSGGLVGRRAGIVSRDSGTQITLGLVEVANNASNNAIGTIGIAFAGAAWKVVRHKTLCAQYKPSAEVRSEYPEDPGTQTWEFLGVNEASQVSVGSTTTYGQRMLLSPFGGVVGYRRKLRITPESLASVDILLDVGTGLSSSTASCKQICCALSDGERVIAWGAKDDVGNLVSRVGFIDVTTGSLLGAGVTWSGSASKFTPGLGLVRIVKTARGRVRLYKQSWQGGHSTTNWELIEEADYDSFPSVGAWSATAPYTTEAHEVAWGTLEGAHTNQTSVEYIDWRVQNVVDFWNKHSTGTVASPNVVEDVGAFISGDVGKSIRVVDFTTLNTSGGNPLGMWMVDSVPDTDHVQLIGEQRWRGYFALDDTKALFVRGESPFRWPDHRGHSIEILDGVNMGVYPISAIIDPETMEDFEEGPQALTIADSVHWDSEDKIALRFASHIIRLDTIGFTVTDVECSWRIIPDLPSGGVDYELVDVGEDASGLLTLRDATPFDAGTVMAVYASKVLSAYLHIETEPNEYIGPGQENYREFPFYLFDGIGYVRRVFQMVKAAGVIPDFDHLVEDTSGRHILGDQTIGYSSIPIQFFQASTGGQAVVSATAVPTLSGSTSGLGSASGVITGVI